MRLLTINFLFVVFCAITSLYAQNDTLLINLKNGDVEKIAISDFKNIEFKIVSGVEDINKQSNGLQLKGNYPNPITEKTNIQFEIPQSGTVVILIYNNNGRIIKQLECSNCQPGKNSLLWDCLDSEKQRVPNGTYFYEVRFGTEVLSKKMIIIK